MSETTDQTRFRDGAELERTDSKGRKLAIKQLSLREEMYLLAAAGGDRADNRRWMMYATMLACVRRINDVPMPFPMTTRGLDSCIDRVGAEGVAVVAQLLAEEATPDSEDEVDPETGSASASPGTDTMAIAKN